ncbi:MAG: hypothetical protein Q4F31_10305 [Eubacteriales bacterium]|nr:hypothetical protein [Eubacteriales bacterium]
MTFTKEMKEKAKKAASAEELLEMAKAEGVELSASDAEMYYNFLHGSRELTDEELSQVAGGKGNDPKPNPVPKYKVGQTVEYTFQSTFSILKGTIIDIEGYSPYDGWKYRIHFTQRTCYHKDYPETRPYDSINVYCLDKNPDAKVY